MTIGRITAGVKTIPRPVKFAAESAWSRTRQAADSHAVRTLILVFLSCPKSRVFYTLGPFGGRLKPRAPDATCTRCHMHPMPRAPDATCRSVGRRFPNPSTHLCNHMLQVALPDGKQLQFDGPTTPADVAAEIGPGLAKSALAAAVDGNTVGLDFALPPQGAVDLRIYTKRDAESLTVMRHSCARNGAGRDASLRRRAASVWTQH